MQLRDEIASLKKRIKEMQEELAALEQCLEDNPGEATERIVFVLDGCDISFVAEAPADITLRQLLAQCDKISPHWCACGIRSYVEDYDYDRIELEIGYDSISKADESASCTIMDDPKWRKKR